VKTRRNRVGTVSLLSALAGFLFVMFQPWIPLDRLILYNALSLKSLLSAFFDASLVGALADWFAVTALFRNPLGVKLRHTDIIAKNKDTIAEAVPRFLTGFVSEERIAVELENVDFGGKVQTLIGEGGSREEIHDFVRTRLSSLLAGYKDGSGAEGLTLLMKELFAFVGNRLDSASAFASFLRWVRREHIDERIIESVAEVLRNEIGKNIARLAASLTPIIKRNAGWQGIFVGQGTVERLLTGVRNELAQIRSNRNHELRRFLDATLDSYTDRLAGAAPDPGGDRGRFRAWVRDVLGDEKFQTSSVQFAANLLARLDVDLAQPQSRFIEALERIERALGDRLGGNTEFRLGFNRGVAGLISGAIAKSRLIESLTGYLATLLKSTDEREFVRRIEDAVGNDLQYIRLNGAVVGGCVGLLLSLLAALVRS
jgi:uncharacterized membrane-anchored protein YjiN (DUF445 family)